MWILPHDYFGQWANHPDATQEVRDNADILLQAVNNLMEEAYEDGIDFKLNPATKSYVSGATYGGFRPQRCTQGAPNSSHKTGQGIDVYDYGVGFAEWCFKHQDRLQANGLYMESPSATVNWCHLTTRAPKSGKRCFLP